MLYLFRPLEMSVGSSILIVGVLPCVASCTNQEYTFIYSGCKTTNEGLVKRNVTNCTKELP